MLSTKDKDKILFQGRLFKNVYDNYNAMLFRLGNNYKITYKLGAILPPDYQDGFAKIVVMLFSKRGNLMPFIELLIDVCFCVAFSHLY